MRLKSLLLKGQYPCRLCGIVLQYKKGLERHLKAHGWKASPIFISDLDECGVFDPVRHEMNKIDDHDDYHSIIGFRKV